MAVLPRAWVAINNGLWNNDPAANPATGTNAIDLSVLNGQLLFPMMGGSRFATVNGPGTQTVNFGASAFAFTVPSGFTAGWPAAGGGWTTFNPATNGGAGTPPGILSNGNLTYQCANGGGFVQAFDGYNVGKYYFEVHFDTTAPILDFFGAGVGRAVPGLVYSNFFNTPSLGGYSSALLHNGGVACVTTHPGGPPDYPTALGALGTTFFNTASFGPYQPGAVMRFAIDMGAAPIPGNTKVAELWFGQTAGFVDMRVESNRRKFVCDVGGASDPGLNGQNPFGGAPVVYLSRRGLPATFSGNNGRGGEFITSGGTLTDPGTAPPACGSISTVVQPNSPGQGVLGDYRNGNLYAFNPATLTDNGTPRKWVRRWRALPGGSMGAVKFSWLTVAMQTGLGVPPDANPILVLRWSDDGGNTWSDERKLAAGRTGATTQTIKFNRLGMTRRFLGVDRIFELSSTDPFMVAILEAEVDAS